MHFSASALCLALAIVICVPLPVKGDNDSATTVYLNGPIVTMNTAQPGAEAVAVRDGKILAVGSAAEVAAAAGQDAKTKDLKGAALLPGFIDAHGHFGGVAMYLAFENIAVPPVGPVKNIADFQRILAGKKTSTPTGEWILGGGYDEAYLEEGRHPNRFDLDQVSTEHPIALIHVSQHFLSCNSKCLEIAGVDASTPDPEGGVIQRVAGSAEPNGVMEEQAMYKLLPYLPIHDVEKFLGLIDRAQDYFASFGITTLQDGASMKSDLLLFDRAAEQGLFKLDLIAYPSYKIPELLDGKYSPSSEYRNHWRVGGVKLGLDGSPQGKTAYLTRPYHVAPPAQDKDYRGYPTMQQDDVNRYLDEYYARGWHTLVHVNGDAAAQQMIDAVALATEKHGLKDRRTTMIHAQTVREDQLDRMEELQIRPPISCHTPTSGVTGIGIPCWDPSVRHASVR
jgi:predicted amidohydrolase YtcJ